MNELASRTRDGDVAIITINNPPVNALSPGVPEEILTCLAEIQKDASIKAVVLIGGGRTFIAGADIKEFGKITSGQKERGEGLRPFLQVIEDYPKPIICAIHGTAFGGGLETAMACHYRVALASAQVGQPEMKLGLIPGAGGTQRLPRLAGVAKAAQMCATGEPVKATEALEHGILDRVLESELLAGAVAFARETASHGLPPRKTRELNVKLADRAANLSALGQVREAVKKKSRGLLAPLKAVDAVEAAATMDFAGGLAKEAQLFKECLFSEQSKALIHIFFAERAVAKIPDVPKDTPTSAIKRAAVVGAGTMGGGIAMVYASAGIPVLLKEASQELLDRGLATIRKNYAAGAERGRMTPAHAEASLARIEPTLTYDRFREADIVVEAVFEEIELKKRIFSELDAATRPDALLVSNTSSLDIDQIASATSRPSRVIGHHFFSPAHIMRLLEIVRGKATAKDVIVASMALAKTLGKLGVLVGNCRGFVGNRMYHCYQREAQFLLEEGASVEQVDNALVDYGMAMGPLATGDLSGLDVGWRIRKAHQHLIPIGQRVPLVCDRLCEMGRYGQKTGAGWYRYEPGNRSPIPDPVVAKLIDETSRTAGIEMRTIAAQEIIERTLYALINEGAKILEEGMAVRAGDIDIIYANGYGFPAYRGGPMWYADTVGLPRVAESLRQFEKRHGEVWKPAELLMQLAASGKRFADWDRDKGVEA